MSQKQNASEGAVAYQAGGDVVVHEGLTPTQMKEILDAVAQTFPAYIAAAREIVSQRIEDFEKRVLERFASGEARSQAFQDPDFVYVVKEAQHAYIRSGDDGIRDTLIDLIARRSNEQTRSRLSMTLNEAVQRSALLTKNEFAELSLVYIVTMVINRSFKDVAAFVQFFRETIEPLLPDVSRESTSYQYLAAQSCATISALGTSSISAIFGNRYPGLFSRGFGKEELAARFAEDRKHLVDSLVIPCLHDESKWQVRVLDKGVLDEVAQQIGLTEAEKKAVWDQIQGATLRDEDWLKALDKEIPEIRDLHDLWSKTPLSRMSLTTIGIAIGHANLVRTCKLNADLKIWIA